MYLHLLPEHENTEDIGEMQGLECTYSVGSDLSAEGGLCNIYHVIVLPLLTKLTSSHYFI
jgi:hypothetical protein